MKILLFIFLLCTLFLVPQQKDEVKDKQAEEAKKPVAGMETKASPQGEFVYNPMGRRDPFWDLLQRNSAKLKKREKPDFQAWI